MRTELMYPNKPKMLQSLLSNHAQLSLQPDSDQLRQTAMSRKPFAFLVSLFGDMTGAPGSGPPAWLRWFANYGLSLGAADHVLGSESDCMTATGRTA